MNCVVVFLNYDVHVLSLGIMLYSVCNISVLLGL